MSRALVVPSVVGVVVAGAYRRAVPPASDLFLRINQFAIDTPWLHGVAAAFATYGILLFGVLILAGWWQARSEAPGVMAAALLTPVAAVVAFLVQQVIVGLVDESRPYAVFPDALVLVGRTTDPSFPSDHACVAGAVAAGLFFVDRRLGGFAAGLAAVMALTRVYVGAHWPLDVVAGLAVGAGVAALVMLVLRAPVARIVERARSGRLRRLVAVAP